MRKWRAACVKACQERGLDPQHARDLITAFKRDVTQLRYRDWDDLVDYCRYSAMPVGRFVCDLHGEDRGRVWPANDALCAALQIINHLQDCGKDYRNLDRVYLHAGRAHGARRLRRHAGAGQRATAAARDDPRPE